MAPASNVYGWTSSLAPSSAVTQQGTSTRYGPWVHTYLLLADSPLFVTDLFAGTEAPPLPYTEAVQLAAACE